VEKNRKFAHISKTQRAVIADLLKNGLNEYEILEKYKISPSRYKKWLQNQVFIRALDAYAVAAERQTRFALIHCQPKAVAKIIKLINEEKGETARKACLDALELRRTEMNQERTERKFDRMAYKTSLEYPADAKLALS
jgi:hypothetical protein